jgi:hypothetical protein
VCAAPTWANDQDKLQDSLKQWQTLKQKHKGNYSYTVRFSSFSGFGNETEIIVRGNRVVERRYRSFNRRAVPPKPGQAAPKPNGKQWVETGKAIGTHKEGADAKTLDKLYSQSADVLKRPLSKNERRYVRFDKQGLLLSCFTVDTRIADDAPRKGVVISRITLGEKDAAKKGAKAPNGKFFPVHWGAPPRIQTRDLRPLPGGYGRGSSTLARWIQMHLDRDAKQKEER